MASKQLILLNPAGEALGTKKEVLGVFARFNTSPDGSKEAAGVAFGPGFHVELPWVEDGDAVPQAALTVVDDDAAWQVLTRLFGETGWGLMDLESGEMVDVQEEAAG